MHHGMFLSAVLSVLVLAALAADVNDNVVGDVQVENPRPFGHFLGDRVTRRIRLTAPRPYTLAQDALPKTERISTWIELTDVAVQSAPGLSGTRYHIDLIYQLINSPTQTQLAPLPDVRLKFTASGRTTIAADIDEWSIAVAPLAPRPAVAKTEPLRPARAPKLIDNGATEGRLILYCTGMVAIGAWLTFVQYVIPRLRLRNGPFAAAQRTIESLTQQPPDEAHLQAALRAMHRAFDQTAGRRLFPEHLGQFLSRHRHFEDLHGSVQHFYEVSSREFFGDGAPIDLYRLDWLLALCAQCRARERNVLARVPGLRSKAAATRRTQHLRALR